MVDGDLQGLVIIVEDKSIAALPYIPCNGGTDCPILKGLRVGEHNGFSRNSGVDLSSQKENSPDLLSTMIGDEQMIHIFIKGAARALSRGGQLVTKTTRIGG
jgi:hypothetical protein